MAPSAISATTSTPASAGKLPPLIPRRKRASSPPPSELPPATPPLPSPPTIDLKTWTFRTPTRRILSRADHEKFLASPTYTVVLSFVFTLADSVRGVSISDVEAQQSSLPPIFVKILKILEEAEALVAAHPPLDTGSRFGNPAFRDYIDAVDQAIPQWHSHLLDLQPLDITNEIGVYLLHSLGSRSRIDYGSGHELNFILWLLCLYQLTLLPTSADNQPSLRAVALLVFPRYLRLVRTIQSTYYLEPAGSHGVWGLDDYQFLPFLFGSSQLVGHKYITPKSIHNPVVLEEEKHSWLYLEQVSFVNSVKTVKGLRWHSPMLDDISSAKSWTKVEGGMRKMFVGEVLGKLPVMQHFLFGSLIPAAEGMSIPENEVDGDRATPAEELEADRKVDVFDDDEGKRHIHDGQGWNDCCGIQVPSAIGAAEELKKRMGRGQELRPIPFD